jgi:hypothetical protein
MPTPRDLRAAVLGAGFADPVLAARDGPLPRALPGRPLKEAAPPVPRQKTMAAQGERPAPRLVQRLRAIDSRAAERGQ